MWILQRESGGYISEKRKNSSRSSAERAKPRKRRGAVGGARAFGLRAGCVLSGNRGRRTVFAAYGAIFTVLVVDFRAVNNADLVETLSDAPETYL